MRIQFAFRDWNQLLILEDATANNEQRKTIEPSRDLVNGAPVLGNTQVWSNYAIVSNDERKRMACAPRDILIEQVQTAPRQSFTPATNAQQSFDVRFSHAIKVLFFAVRNSTWPSEWSQYVTSSPTSDGLLLTTEPKGAYDPILQTSLIYENTNRLAQMGSDYFSLINPYYSAPAIPRDTGYHSYSYSLDFYCLDPMGSTNFGKLTNVSIVLKHQNQLLMQMLLEMVQDQLIPVDQKAQPSIKITNSLSPLLTTISFVLAEVPLVSLSSNGLFPPKNIQLLQKIHILHSMSIKYE